MRNTKRQDAKTPGKAESNSLLVFLASWRLGVCICLCCLAATPATTRIAKMRIVLAGDSTVAEQNGWGPGFAKSLADDVECINIAGNGRSSKSFRSEGRWQKCLDAKPDYILIQFGHNDQPGKGERSTDLATEFPKNIAQYVEE